MDKRRIVRFNSNGEQKVTFLSPYYHQGRGNATTARRIVTGLNEFNIDTNVVAYNEQPLTAEWLELIEKSSLLHILHFRRFAEWQGDNQLFLDKPYVITSGGTDVNIDIFKPEYQDNIGIVLENAAAITVFSEDAKQKLQSIYRNLDSKIHIVKQSVWFPEINQEISTSIKLSEVGPNIVLPAGLRAVKDVLYVLPAILELKQVFPTLTFTIVGAPLERSVLQEVEKVIEKNQWINYYEEIPLEEMAGLYRQSDIIINTSLSEGQSSALLEAMFLGKPVIARNNGGNKSIIEHGENGFLFDDVYDFFMYAKELLRNKERREFISKCGKNYVIEKHSLHEEISKYLRLYNDISQ